MPNFMTASDLRDLVVFRDRIGEQALAHLARLAPRRVRVGGVDLEHEMATDVHVGDAAEPEGVQRVGDSLALRIEKPTARYDLHCDAIAAHSLLSVSGVEAGAEGGPAFVSVGERGGALGSRGGAIRSSSS